MLPSGSVAEIAHSYCLPELSSDGFALPLSLNNREVKELGSDVYQMSPFDVPVSHRLRRYH